MHVGFLEIVSTHNNIPGKHGRFTNLSSQTIDQGRIAFCGDGNFGYSSIYSNTVGRITLVADSNTLVPFSHGYFTKFGPYIVMQGSVIVFGATSTDHQCGIYRFAGNQLSLIADSQTPMPGGAHLKFSRFVNPWLLDDGQVVFIGSSGKDYGVFAADKDGHLQLLMNANNTAIPKGQGNFVSLEQLAFNPKGSMKRFAFIGKGKNKQQGVYLSYGARVQKIADRNTLMPQSIGFFSSFGDISIDHKQVAFVGRGIMGQQGIYLSTVHGLIKLIDTETLTPQGQGKFDHFDKLLFRNGMIIFHASSDNHHRGVYLYSLRYGLFKILSDGDTINHHIVYDATINAMSLDNHYLALVVTFQGSAALEVATLKIAPY